MAAVAVNAQDSMRILVAAHKPYWMPVSDLYLPMHVGATGKESIPGFQRDDIGENISARNPHYSELTALYWGWKNLDCDSLGLVHYRRYFAGGGERGIATREEMQMRLAKTPVVLPKKRHYVIETVESHYAHTMDVTHFDIIRELLEPNCRQAFDRCVSKRSIRIFNMFVMRRDILDEYCSWLFPTLAKFDEALNYDGLTSFEARATGRVSERLLDPWIEVNGIEYTECAVKNLEPVNWGKKISGVMAAKFAGKKYRESF